jgi:hypothetical protein
VGDLFRGIIDGVAVVVTAFDAAFRVIDSTINLILGSVRTLALGIVTPVAAVLELAASIPKVGDAFRGAADAASSEMNRLSDAVNENAAGIQNAFTKDTFLSGVLDGIAEARTQFDVFEQEAINSANTIKNNTSAVTGGGADPAQVQKESQLQAEILAIQQQGLIDQAAFKEQFRISESELQGVRNAEDIVKLAEFEQQKLDLALQAEIDKNNIMLQGRERDLANQKAIEAAKLKSQQLNNKAIIDSQKAQAIQEQQIQQTRIAALQGFLGAGLTLAKQGSKEAKAIQTASAIVSTYTAANQALSSPPGPPFTLPLVAATIAQGLANVSKINSQSFATGGIIGQGATMGGDNRIAQVRDGELVLNGNQQKNLFDAINSGQLGGNQPIIINIDGRKIAEVVREQVQGGFSLA